MALAQVPLGFVSTASSFPWAVTPSNPVRGLNHMDHERCAALHNHIVEAGWTGSGRAIDALERRSWFEFWGNEAEEVRTLLSTGLAAFLDSAIEPGDEVGFTYYIGSLAHPSKLFEAHEGFAEGEDHRYLTLYSANDIAEHPVGLVYDQQTDKAIIQMTIEDRSTILNGRQPWYPCEVVLSAWLDIIQTGKMKAIDEENFGGHRYDIYSPWMNLPYSDAMLQETLNVFHELIEAIEARMPAESLIQPHAVGLVSEAILDCIELPPTFPRIFLLQATRPRFKFIAPGLEVPNDATFTSQPFVGIPPDMPLEEGEEGLATPPILLFRSSGTAPSPDKGDPFFPPPYTVENHPAGVYFTQSDRRYGHQLEDEVKFILPYALGGNGHARKSDGSRFGEDTEDDTVQSKDVYDELYQPGFTPFLELHGPRLVGIFRSWLGMVQRGDWAIDASGVAGTIEAFREADMEHTWSKFVLPVAW